MPATYDVAIVGAGPAGSTCAALCAAGGLRVLLLERATFPREKVCGDCLNPACWPVLDRLGVSERLRALPHSQLESVEFIGISGNAISVPLRSDARGEIAIRRSVFDELLCTRAAELGAAVRENTTVTAIEPGWQIRAGDVTFQAAKLVAADGRNSTIARLLGLLPSAAKDRVGVQTHIAAPAAFGAKVQMRLLPRGYCGVASVGEDLLNVCLVSRAQHLGELKAWAGTQFQLPADQPWRTITPLARPAVSPARENLLLVGDVARVVEPFTGEGIYYALASGALAADHLLRGDLPGYSKAHAQLYRGRLWINQFAKAAVLHPRLGSLFLNVAARRPGLLRWLTSKVIPGAS